MNTQRNLPSRSVTNLTPEGAAVRADLPSTGVSRARTGAEAGWRVRTVWAMWGASTRAPTGRAATVDRSGFRRARGLAVVALTAALLAGNASTGATGASASPSAGPAAAATASAPPGQLPVVVDGAVTAFTRMGPDVVVAGTFTKVQLSSGVTVNQRYLFAYDFATGAFDTAFRPVLDDPVLTVAGNDSGVYAGGSFVTVNGLPASKVVRLLPDGSVDRAFRARADRRVEALALSGGRLFLGGQFRAVNGYTRTRLAQVSAVTGAVSKAFTLALTGSAGAGGNAGVQSLQLSPDGTRLLVAHTAQRLAGQVRYGVALVDLTGPTAKLDPWRTTLWRRLLPQTGGVVRVTDAAWGPDSQWFVVSNTGGDRPPVNDSVQRFDLGAAQPAEPTWVTRMFDSVYSVTVGPDGSVYCGGHFRFTEAPGSVEPYPGDPDINYGGGVATQGARTLGSQVVMRDQVAALSPVTGKALNWWSSANGQRGVLGLMVSGDRLLIGQDGTKVGGQPTGRFGQVPAYGAPVDPTVPQTTVTTPLLGANLDIGPLTVAGTATAPAGVDRVQVEVKRASTGEWLQPDGAWGSAFSAFPAAVPNRRATSSSYSVDISLPAAGEFLVLVKAWDVDGQSQYPKTSVRILTNDPLNAPPTSTWTSPSAGQSSFTSNTFTVAGTASDPQGVDAVSLTFYNRDLNSYVGADGAIGEFVSPAAQLSDPGATFTRWSLRVTLPDGEYLAHAKGTDGLGATDPGGAKRSFQLHPGNAAPRTSLDRPTRGARVGGPFTVSGRATDDRGVSKVAVRVADTRFGRGPQRTGTYGRAVWLPARLADRGARSTRWSVRVPRLPFGTYTVRAYAIDRDGVMTPPSAQPSRTIHRWPRGASGEPTTRVASPKATSRFADLSLTAAGSASYERGVRAVRYALYNTDLGRYLQPDDTLGSVPFLFTASLSDGGADRTAWTASRPLPRAGVWRLDAVAVGADGSVDSSPFGSRVTLLVFPGDDDPTVTLNSPVDAAVLTGTQGILSLGGRAFDDHGVRAVQVLVRNVDGTRGMCPDHSFCRRPAWTAAFVTNPGGLSTNWSLATPALPKGTWRVSARAVDSVGKATPTYPTHTVTVAS
jgi:hypothetical protein